MGGYQKATGPTEGLTFTKGGGLASPAPDVASEIDQLTASIEGAKPQCVTEPGGTGGSTSQLNVTAAPALVKVRNECRIAIKVTQLGTKDVWLGFSPSVSSITGDLLPGVRGSFIIIPSVLDIWAVCGTGDTSSLSFMEITI